MLEPLKVNYWQQLMWGRVVFITVKGDLQCLGGGGGGSMCLMLLFFFFTHIMEARKNV